MYELEAATLGAGFILAAFYFLAKSIQHRHDIRNVTKVAGRNILDTSREWLYFTSFLGLAALGAHIISEFSLHLYETTPIDRFTHGLSGMAVTAIMLNFNFGRNRTKYYLTAIALSWIVFVAWEIMEGIVFWLNPLWLIQVDPWDAAIDLWIDFLGGLSVCFLSDELTQ